MPLSLRNRRTVIVVISVIAIVGVLFLVYRTAAHLQKVAALNVELHQIRQLNGRDRAVALRLQATAANFKAQFFSALDMTDMPASSASATASLMSDRLERLGRHVREIDAVILKARSLADQHDSIHIRRDTSIALNRRVRVTELVSAVKAVIDDFRANPYAAMAFNVSANDVGRKLGHASYGLSKSLRVIADDLGVAIHRRSATASRLQRDVRHLEHAGPFSL